VKKPSRLEPTHAGEEKKVTAGGKTCCAKNQRSREAPKRAHVQVGKRGDGIVGALARRQAIMRTKIGAGGEPGLSGKRTEVLK